MAKSEKAKARNREWMRAYRATPAGRTATILAKQKRYASPEGRAVMQEGKRRWKKSECGKESGRRLSRKYYVPHPPQRLSTAQRKTRAKASWLRSVSRPAVKAKRRETAWRSHLKRRYRLTIEQYEQMASCGCQICGARDTQRKRLHVDHNHDTGVVRGVLCDPCNRGLGCFRDNAKNIAAALSYLKGE